MNIVEEIFSNRVVLAAIIGFFSAQGVKVLSTYIRYHRFDLERIMGSGGMPSSHTATITAATFSIGHQYGFDQPIFALGMVVSLIVMYDAAGVRMAAGKQARVIKMIIKEIGEHRIKYEGELKELLGHTYLEVFVGFVLGIVIGLNI